MIDVRVSDGDESRGQATMQAQGTGSPPQMRWPPPRPTLPLPVSAPCYGTVTKSSKKDRAVAVSFLNAHEIALHRPVSPSATATTTLESPRK